MRVGEVLELPPMEGARILAGSDGLDREVTGVNIIEVPDVRRWLRGGEFLFSAGYAWRDEPDALVELIRQLDQIGVSAIGLKLGPYMPKVSRRAKGLADRLGFPLIRIPPAVAYMDVIDPIYRHLAARRRWVLEGPLDPEEVLTSLGLDDQSIEAIAQALAGQLGNPVHVFDAIDDSVVLAVPGRPPRRCASEDLEPELREAGSEGVAGGSTRRPAAVLVGERRGLAASLVVGRRRRGRIVVVEESAPLEEFAERAVQRVAELISFLLMKRMAVIEGRREAGRLLLDSLLSDELSSEEATERAITLGLRLSSRHVVLLIGLCWHRNDHLEVLSNAVDQAFAAYPHVVGVAAGGRHLLALLEITDPDEADHLEEAVAALQAAGARSGVRGVLVGSGSALPGLEGVRRSRSEATIAYRTAERMAGTAGLVRFADLGVERLLAQIPATAETHEYVTRMLGPVASDPQLLRTLEVFLERGGNKVAAAAAIPLHRSSLMYRLDKISRLLDIDLHEPERFLELWLAIRLRRIIS